MPSFTRFRASYVLPISQAAQRDAEVVVGDGVIHAVRSAAPAGSDTVIDFGEAILLPGLVNAHTHLDYTAMRGAVEDLAFFPWIRKLTAMREAFDPEDWAASAAWGALEALAGGVTCVGDCSPTGAAVEGLKRAGLGGVVFQEVFGIGSQNGVEEMLAQLSANLARLERAAAGSNVHLGISPHALYTVPASWFGPLQQFAAVRGLRVCTHVAESVDECRLIRAGQGEFAAMLSRRGLEWQPGGGSCVEYLEEHGGLGPTTLLVHGVQLAERDAVISRDSGATWVHCPKSNAKLGAGIASLALLKEASSGAPALGTDSVVSNNGMDMFEEMRFGALAQRAMMRCAEAPSSAEFLQMATIHGARALGFADRGTLDAGKRADLCAVSLDHPGMQPCYSPEAALVFAATARDVAAVAVAGELLYDTGAGARHADRFLRADAAMAASKLKRAQSRMLEWRDQHRET